MKKINQMLEIGNDIPSKIFRYMFSSISISPSHFSNKGKKDVCFCGW